MSAHSLILGDVCIKRGETAVLTGVSAQLSGRQIVALIGPNGAGKSTLLSAIAGLLPSSGTIIWCDVRPSSRTAAFMPQSTDISSGLSVMETVLLGRYDGLGWRIGARDLDAAESALASLDLQHLAQRRLDSLSGGQRQLVLLAQRLVRRPQLLLLDESTSALDLRHQMSVLLYLRAYVEETGALVVMAMHDLNLAARHADTIMMLAHGGLSAVGPGATVLTEGQLRRDFGIEADVISRDEACPIIVPRAPLRRIAGD